MGRMGGTGGMVLPFPPVLPLLPVSGVTDTCRCHGSLVPPLPGSRRANLRAGGERPSAGRCAPRSGPACCRAPAESSRRCRQASISDSSSSPICASFSAEISTAPDRGAWQRRPRSAIMHDDGSRHVVADSTALAVQHHHEHAHAVHDRQKIDGAQDVARNGVVRGHRAPRLLDDAHVREPFARCAAAPDDFEEREPAI